MWGKGEWAIVNAGQVSRNATRWLCTRRFAASAIRTNDVFPCSVMGLFFGNYPRFYAATNTNRSRIAIDRTVDDRDAENRVLTGLEYLVPNRAGRLIHA